jgi:hypothetical protein
VDLFFSPLPSLLRVLFFFLFCPWTLTSSSTPAFVGITDLLAILPYYIEIALQKIRTLPFLNSAHVSFASRLPPVPV